MLCNGTGKIEADAASRLMQHMKMIGAVASNGCAQVWKKFTSWISKLI
jgi:hypothetical protein